MDVFKPALDNRLSPKACVSSSEEAEADVFRWPRPDDAISAAPDAAPAARGFWTAVFDYEATADDELSLRRGDLVEVLSKDSLVSGDEGWWTGMIADRVGIFPSNYVSNGNGIPEETRHTSEQQYSVPPLHREYPHCAKPIRGWRCCCVGPCLSLVRRPETQTPVVMLCHGGRSALRLA